MFALKNIFVASKDLVSRLHSKRIYEQQRNDADETEMRNFVHSSTDFTKEISYDPHARHVEEAEDVDMNKKAGNRSPKTVRYTSGWRFGAINCAISASFVFLVNFVVTIIFATGEDGVLFDGDCERARQLNTGIHLLINLLSTVLLSSSNYCMQCLSAPTRKEIDQAHAQGRWLDIGVQSVHNLRNINVRRTIIWFLLGASSLPLHLL